MIRTLIAACEADRLPRTVPLIELNCKGGPERVEELADIVSGYARVAGFTVQEAPKGSPPLKG